MRKIFLLPYFGDLPPWYDKWLTNFEEVLRPKGYDFLLDQDLEGFKKRVKEKLGIEYPGLPNTGKVWDYRCALGYLYEDEIKGYDFWGHTDFDCVYGDVEKYLPDEFLKDVDVHSNHHSYVMGAWALYKNKPEINKLFLRGPWYENMIGEQPTGWVEKEFSSLLEESEFKWVYTFHQGNPWTKEPKLSMINGKLYQDGEEIMQFHFRHSKKWPL